MEAGDECLVTGVTGYVGSWVAKRLLERGFCVRGTVRHLEGDDRLPEVRKALHGAELYEADIRQGGEEGRKKWSRAVEGCKWVFHVASSRRSEKGRADPDVVEAAVFGMENVLRAVFMSKSVQRVVITSSEAAIAYGHRSSKTDFTEDDWTIVDGPGVGDYYESKTMAERRAWELSRNKRTNPRGVELAAVNPGVVLGPTLFRWAGKFPLAMIADIAEGKMPTIPHYRLHIVDVRDCADMHLVIMNSPKAPGCRFFSVGLSAWFVEIAEVIRSSFADQGLHPSAMEAPAFLLFIPKTLQEDFHAIFSRINKECTYTTKYPDIYRYRYTALREIVCDTVKSLLEHELVGSKRRKLETLTDDGKRKLDQTHGDMEDDQRRQIERYEAMRRSFA